MADCSVVCRSVCHLVSPAKTDEATEMPFALRTHTKKLCSRLLWTEVEFYWQKQQNRVLCYSFGDLGVTYTVHLWLVGKRIIDFL